MSKLPRPLDQMEQEARRDDWHRIFVGSDIRQLIGRIRELEAANNKYQRVCDGCGGIVSGAEEFPCPYCGEIGGGLLSIAYLRMRDRVRKLEAAAEEVPMILAERDAFQSENTQLIRELAHAQAVVDKLPMTDDGVHVVPEMEVYFLSDNIKYHDGRPVMMRRSCDIGFKSEGEKLSYGDCFSTKAAAEAAQRAGKENG